MLDMPWEEQQIARVSLSKGISYLFNCLYIILSLYYSLWDSIPTHSWVKLYFIRLYNLDVISFGVVAAE